MRKAPGSRVAFASGAPGPGLETGPFFWLMTSVFVVALGYGVALPVLPSFLERLLGDSQPGSVSSHVGVMTGTYAFSMFLFATWWGRLSDRVGRRPVILAGLGGFVAMLAAFGLSPNLVFAYASRILGGLFAASILPVSAAYIADMGSPELRARRFAWMGAAGLLGFLAGPMLGGWLSDPGTPGASSFATDADVPLFAIPFIAASALGAAVWVLDYLQIPRHARHPAASAPATALTDRYDSKTVNALLLLTLLISFGLGSFEVGIVLHGREMLGFGPERLGRLFVACMLVMAATQGLVFPLLIRHWPARVIAPASFATAAAGLLALPSTSAFGWLVAAIGLVAAGSGLLAPVLSYRTSLAAGPAQGAALGKLAAATSLGQAIGSVLAGFGFASWGRGLFWATAGVLLVGAVLSLAKTGDHAGAPPGGAARY